MSYSVFVNTCDKFEDCWNPFFTLFSRYWPDYKGKIYLNTEYKDYSFPGLDIVALKCCQNKSLEGNRATWSQCLKWALNAIQDEVVLYLQEDYFFKAPVKNSEVESFAEIIKSDETVGCIQLTDQSVSAGKASQYDHLKIVENKPLKRVSCQAAFWKKSVLISLIRDYESGWDFECFGTKRSEFSGHKYFVVDPEYVLLDQYEIVPYIFTGIIKGKWYKPTEKLFSENGIQMDFSKRGFFENEQLPFHHRVLQKVKRIAKWIRFYKNIYFDKK